MASYLLDIENADKQLKIERLHVGDNGIRTLEFVFVKGGRHMDLDADCIATIYALLPDGTKIYEPCDVVDDKVIYSLTGGADHPSLTALEGEITAEIRLTFNNGKVITSPSFSIFCDGVLQDDSAVESQESFSALTDALSKVLDTQHGLDSKLDRAEGAEGNLVVFGPDGTVADGGAPARICYVPYYDEPTNEQKEEIKKAVNKLKGEKVPYTVLMVLNDADGYILPAQSLISEGTSNIISVMRGLMDLSHTVKYNIQLTASGNVRCWSEDISSASGTGEDGATFIPSVDNDGTLSWTNDKGLESPLPVNIVDMVIDALPTAEEASF